VSFITIDEWIETCLRENGLAALISRDFADSFFVPIRALSTNEPRYFLIEITFERATLSAALSALIAGSHASTGLMDLLGQLAGRFQGIRFELDDDLVLAKAQVPLADFLLLPHRAAVRSFGNRFFYFTDAVDEASGLISAGQSRSLPRVLREAIAVVAGVERDSHL
jgi:hypothetical protein